MGDWLYMSAFETTVSRFAIDVPLSERGQPGLYEVSVWAKLGTTFW